MKRLFDLVLGIILVVLLLPLMMIVAVLVLAVLGRPIFFRQKRPGKNSVPFNLVKFRSMNDVDGADEVRLENSAIFSASPALMNCQNC